MKNFQLTRKNPLKFDIAQVLKKKRKSLKLNKKKIITNKKPHKVNKKICFSHDNEKITMKINLFYAKLMILPHFFAVFFIAKQPCVCCMNLKQ